MATGGSLNSNPPNSDIDINHAASNWLWAVFAIMLVSDLAFILWSFRLPTGLRVFHQIPIVILTTASLAYFSMASDLGATPIATEFRAGGATRAIWYVRYIDWTITTPFLLLELLLATGLNLSEILIVVFMDLVMIIAGLVGSLVVSQYKWGYFVFGLFAQFFIWYYLLVKAPAATTAMGVDIKRAYMSSALFLSLVWLLYPVAWGLADGGNVISSLGEMIFYGILDLIAKPLFCFYHVYRMRQVPYESLMLASGKASTGVYGAYQPTTNALINEKHVIAPGVAATGVNVGGVPAHTGHAIDGASTAATASVVPRAASIPPRANSRPADYAFRSPSATGGSPRIGGPINTPVGIANTDADNTYANSYPADDAYDMPVPMTNGMGRTDGSAAMENGQVGLNTGITGVPQVGSLSGRA